MQPWMILLVCAVLCAVASAWFACRVVQANPAKRLVIPLAMLGGIRLFLLGTFVLSVLLTALLIGPGAFAVYDRFGEKQLMWDVRMWGTTFAFWGVLALPLEFVYALAVQWLARQRVWRPGLALAAPFAVLVVLILVNVGMFVPMI